MAPDGLAEVILLSDLRCGKSEVEREKGAETAGTVQVFGHVVSALIAPPQSAPEPELVVVEGTGPPLPQMPKPDPVLLLEDRQEQMDPVGLESDGEEDGMKEE